LVDIRSVTESFEAQFQRKSHETPAVRPDDGDTPATNPDGKDDRK